MRVKGRQGLERGFTWWPSHPHSPVPHLPRAALSTLPPRAVSLFPQSSSQHRHTDTTTTHTSFSRWERTRPSSVHHWPASGQQSFLTTFPQPRLTFHKLTVPRSQRSGARRRRSRRRRQCWLAYRSVGFECKLSMVVVGGTNCGTECYFKIGCAWLHTSSPQSVIPRTAEGWGYVRYWEGEGERHRCGWSRSRVSYNTVDSLCRGPTEEYH